VHAHPFAPKAAFDDDLPLRPLVLVRKEAGPCGGRCLIERREALPVKVELVEGRLAVAEVVGVSVALVKEDRVDVVGGMTDEDPVVAQKVALVAKRRYNRC